MSDLLQNPVSKPDSTGSKPGLVIDRDYMIPDLVSDGNLDDIAEDYSDEENSEKSEKSPETDEEQDEEEYVPAKSVIFSFSYIMNIKFLLYKSYYVSLI